MFGFFRSIFGRGKRKTDRGNNSGRSSRSDNGSTKSDWKIPAGKSLAVSQKAIDEVIIKFEVGGRDYYDLKYQQPIWPQGESGVTVGIGYDLGYNTAEQIREDWTGIVENSIVDHLASVAGIKNDEARERAKDLKEKQFKITFDQAHEVFTRSTLPTHGGKTLRTYPGLEQLPPDAQGALLSLVYNRGPSLSGDTRTEMANIKEHVASGDLEAIAMELEAMERVWRGKPIYNGLKKRRDAEAKMVRESNRNYPQGEIIHV